MYSTDYKAEPNESRSMIYTTEQWLRSIKVSKISCDTVAKPMENSSDRRVLSNDLSKVADIE